MLLLAVAPELDLRYEVLYAYLNNDVTRKRPTCDLGLRLFCACAEERWERRRHFAPDAPLFRDGLLEWLPENPDAPASSLARSFKAPLRVVDYLLEAPSRESKLFPFTEEVSPRKTWDDLLLPADFLTTLRGAVGLMRDSRATVIVFEGSEGAGRQSCAEALCRDLGCALLVVDAEALMASQAELPGVCTLLGREQRLDNAGIYLRRAEAFFDAEGRLLPRAHSLAQSLNRCRPPVVLGCTQSCDLKALLPEIPFHVFRFPTLPFPLRRELWQKEIETTFGGCDGTDLEALANQFVLTGGQIRDAVQSARDRVAACGSGPGRCRQPQTSLRRRGRSRSAICARWRSGSSRSIRGTTWCCRLRR